MLRDIKVTHSKYKIEKCQQITMYQRIGIMFQLL